MEGMEYFYELFESLPRCGPGNNESTRKAFRMVGDLPEKPLILDIGCGPGVQTLELARISNGRILALDNHQPFLDELGRRSEAEGLSANIETVNMSMTEMDFENGTFDLIWSEGALYNMGFQNGLRKCHELLKPSGYLAVTELVLLSSDPPVPVMEYLKDEYPPITNIRNNLDLIENENFELLSNFTLDESIWMDSYYLPMEKELDRLENKYAGNMTALDVMAIMRKEIGMYRKYGKFYGYEFFVMRKPE